MIKKYNHYFNACNTIMETLSQFDNFNDIYAELIKTCVIEFKHELILPEILNKFVDRISKENYSNENKIQNTFRFDLYSNFLMKLYDKLNSNLLPYLSIIENLLKHDSCLIRDSIIYIYGEITRKILNREACVNNLKSKTLQNKLLDKLYEHMHDQDLKVRKKTISTWHLLFTNKELPFNYMNKVMERCVGRIEDKASSVRKIAFELLSDLICENSFGIINKEASMNHIKSEYDKENSMLIQMLENQNEFSNNESLFLSNSNKLIEQQNKVENLKYNIEFIVQIKSIIPKLSDTLFSKIKLDVLNVIKLFLTCYEHGLTDMLYGIRKMLSLDLYADEAIKYAVVEVYKIVYLKDKNDLLKTANQLIELVKDLNLFERGALEEIICQLVLNNELNNLLIEKLWELFRSDDLQQNNALVLLGMIIKQKPDIGRSKIIELVESGFNISNGIEAMDTEMIRVCETCHVLSLIGSGSDEIFLTNTKPFKLINEHFAFVKIDEIILNQFINKKNNFWTKMVENALSYVFKLANNPIILAESINENLFCEIRNLISGSDNQNIDASFLSRYFSFIGVIASELLNFLNKSYLYELKRRNKQNKKVSDKFKNDNPNEELILVESFIENKICGQNSLFINILPTILDILSDPIKYSDEILQLSCSKAILKMMLFSSKICTPNLKFMFNLLDKSNNSLVKSNLIIGIGDLVCKFPNALEPWISHLYLPLRDDKSTDVRINTIKIVSQLILKERIKICGQIFEIALCIADPDEKISTFSKIFFEELALRQNGIVIFNLMPEILNQISECSNEKICLKTSAGTSIEMNPSRSSEESFHTIVTFLFSLIEKNNCEELIEFLCTSLSKKNISERKCNDLAFCLSKIQLTESIIKKLNKKFRCYADKLYNQVVYDTFKQIILKNARNLPRLKNKNNLNIDEFETKIESIRKKYLEESETIEDDTLEDNQEYLKFDQNSKKYNTKNYLKI